MLQENILQEGSMRLPPWIKKKAPSPKVLEEMEKLLYSLSLATVCREAKCPNIGECFSRKTATFMILGKRCTRNCRFCAVEKGNPLPLDPEEPNNVARAVKRLSLSYVVITSVTRDDLLDGGARQFVQTIKSIRSLCGENVRIEILVPDFKGSLSSLRKVLKARPNVLNHNLETVARLYPGVRPQANYQRSLEVLKRSKEINPHIYTKSGIMVGLGELFEEVVRVMEDLRKVDCDLLTIGQYLRPSPHYLEVKEFISPKKFQEYGEIARDLGFLCVASSPFTRSSYHAQDMLNHLNK